MMGMTMYKHHLKLRSSLLVTLTHSKCINERLRRSRRNSSVHVQPHQKVTSLSAVSTVNEGTTAGKALDASPWSPPEAVLVQISSMQYFFFSKRLVIDMESNLSVFCQVKVSM